MIKYCRPERFIGVVLMWFCLVGCSHHYNISGNLSDSPLQGRTLYLAVISDAEQRVYVDSCKVVHGQFAFAGPVDSVILGHLDLDGRMIMPIVIEQGEMDVSVDMFGTGISGGALNVRLNNLFGSLNKIQQEWISLNEYRVRLMASKVGTREDFERISQIEDSLNNRTEQLQTSFIIDNFDNVLGPGMFMMICNQYPMPIMTPQLHEILNRAPRMFLTHPRVSAFLRRVNYEFPKHTE